MRAKARPRSQAMKKRMRIILRKTDAPSPRSLTLKEWNIKVFGATPIRI